MAKIPLASTPEKQQIMMRRRLRARSVRQAAALNATVAAEDDLQEESKLHEKYAEELASLASSLKHASTNISNVLQGDREVHILFSLSVYEVFRFFRNSKLLYQEI